MRLHRFVLAAVVLAASLGVWSAAPQPAAAAERQFALNLATRTDWVGQTNLVQCVGASMQMMLNMVRPRDDRTAATQLDLQNLARALSPVRPDGRTRKGASVVGWSDGLNQLGAGPYRLVGTRTIDEALRLGAAAIRETGRPVGLLVWQGRHAWVMSGFRATGDPLRADYRVTGVNVLDPLYPRNSARWGRSPRPGQELSVAELGKQFVPRRQGPSANVWLSGFGGMYVMVLPHAPFDDALVATRPGPARPA